MKSSICFFSSDNLKKEEFKDLPVNLTQEEIYMSPEFRESLKAVIKGASEELKKVYLK